MQTEPPRPFNRVSFSRQFTLLSLGMLLVSMLVVGTWLQGQLEHSAAGRAAASAALYVEGVLSDQLASRPHTDLVDGVTREALDRLFVAGPLSREVVRFKLWGPDGSILYCSDAAQEGQRFPVEGLRAAAFEGEVKARMSRLDQADNDFERAQWTRLLEVYVPVRAFSNGAVIAVAEFYHLAANLSRDIRSAQIRAWALVVLGTATVYLLLLGLVRRANTTILDHQRDLRRKLGQLRTALRENEAMRDRLREAGARSTALNEQFLHRVAADLHDGPAQDVALALLRLDGLAEAWGGCGSPVPSPCADLEVVLKALHACLTELRAIASGLSMPEIEHLSLGDTVRRAVRDFERESRTTVRLDVDGVEDEAPAAVKITLYRVLQEALTNGWRHAQASPQRVRVSLAEGDVLMEVADQGPGFDYRAASAAGRLGLACMNERVRLLGGAFEVDTAPGRGTRVNARLPLTIEAAAHA